MSCTIVGSDTTTRETCDCWRMLDFDANNQYEYYTSETGSITPELSGNYSINYEFVDYLSANSVFLQTQTNPYPLLEEH